jgi:hypothetical protein
MAVASWIAAYPAAMDAAAYPAARPHACASSIFTISSCIVENVESPPHSPVPSSGRRYADSGSRSCNRVTK